MNVTCDNLAGCSVYLCMTDDYERLPTITNGYIMVYNPWFVPMSPMVDVNPPLGKCRW